MQRIINAILKVVGLAAFMPKVWKLLEPWKNTLVKLLSEGVTIVFGVLRTGKRAKALVFTTRMDDKTGKVRVSVHRELGTKPREVGSTEDPLTPDS